MRQVGGGSFDPQGPAAETISGLWWLMLGLGAAVFVLVAALLTIALFRPRPPGDAEPAAPTSKLHRRWIVAGVVAMPVAVLVIVFGATLHAMRSVRNTAPEGALVVEVIGHQWWWEIRYPDEGIITANELHIPVARPVTLRLRSADVIHSFWVPALGGKMDLLPEGTNTLVLQADEAGEHLSQCAEFCGLQHTKMALTVVAEPPDRFASWVSQQQRPAAEPAAEVARRGRDVFLAAGCASCHTVRGTAAQGTKGPDLTHLARRPTLGAATVRNTSDNLAKWVTDPHQIKEGVMMPAARLPGEQLDPLIAYLETLE